VHFVVVVLLVEVTGWRPLVANVAGWLCAFGVSFTGHHRLTFAGHDAPVTRAAARFFLVSATGFAVNEATYALALHFSPLRYDLLLAVILVAVAALTYLASRHWAFAGTRPMRPAPER
jgi:putative flippase GtrA